MAEHIRWERPRGTVHNVNTALALKDTGCNILVVSDAALYVLQNWTALDIEFKSRWADSVTDKGYIPISRTSPNFAAWVDLVEQIQGEVVDMSCDIVAVLEEIRDTIALQTVELDQIQTEIQNLIAVQAEQETAIDQLEPIMDAINVILGGAAILAG